MSLPNASWTSTVDSGVNVCDEPSRWDWKTTPCSEILRRPLRLNTWKPPESVRMAFGHDMKRCKSAEFADQLVAGPEEEVIGVGEDDFGAEVLGEIALREAFDGGLGADGHEDGSFDIAVGGVEDAGAGAGVGAFGDDVEGDLAQASIVTSRGTGGRRNADAGYEDREIQKANSGFRSLPPDCYFGGAVRF